MRAMLLVAGLALGCVGPEISSSLVILLGGVSILLLRPRHGVLLARPVIWMPLLALALLAMAFALGSKTAFGALGIVYFVPMLLLLPMLALVRSEPEDAGSLPAFFAAFCLVGAGGAAAVASYDHFVLGLTRAGQSVANPIHFADVAVVLGFLSLIGLFSPRRPVRLVFVLGPVLALLAVVLSGSRGPLTGFAALLFAVIAGWVVWTGMSRRIVWTLAALVIAAAIAVLWFTWSQPDTMIALGNRLSGMLRAGDPRDASSAERLLMYQGALGAFLAAPWFGYGLFEFVLAAAKFGPPGVTFPVYGHLHSDIADFAVSGGIAGLLGYGLLLAAPLAEALTARPGPTRRPALLGALVLTLGYLVMGLTNAVFGIMMLTVVYAMGCIAVTLMARPG